MIEYVIMQNDSPLSVTSYKEVADQEVIRLRDKWKSMYSSEVLNCPYFYTVEVKRLP